MLSLPLWPYTTSSYVYERPLTRGLEVMFGLEPLGLYSRDLGLLSFLRNAIVYTIGPPSIPLRCVPVRALDKV